MPILPLFIAVFAFRLISLFVSLRNEKRLKAQGAKEYGKANSLLLTLAHIAFYFCAFYEGYAHQVQVDGYTYVGVGLFLFSMGVLWYVIYSLGPIWTIKLIIAPHHPINHSWLFRIVRHPNYFLNVIPELVSIALLCQAWHVLAIGLPLYLIPLGIRIYQEERVMKGMM